ncbi:hypothetical protein D3C74_461930 [compost metagenome]
MTVVFLSGTALLVIAALLVVFLKEIPLRSGEARTEVKAGEKAADSKLKEQAPAVQ